MVDGKFEYKNQWVLDTDGVNLIEIMGNKYVSSKKTYSNDIYETYNLLGIEAARHALLKEINECLQHQGAYVNYRHLSLLVDIMTNKGTMMSIDRHGINRGDIGPLAKSSFEETTDQLLKAAIFGEVDKIKGVSSNIMLGQVAACGTGDCDILLDEIKLMELLSEQRRVVESEEEQEDTESESDEGDYCSTDHITFDYDPAAIKVGADETDLLIPEIQLEITD